VRFLKIYAYFSDGSDGFPDKFWVYFIGVFFKLSQQDGVIFLVTEHNESINLFKLNIVGVIKLAKEDFDFFFKYGGSFLEDESNTSQHDVLDFWLVPVHQCHEWL